MPAAGPEVPFSDAAEVQGNARLCVVYLTDVTSYAPGNGSGRHVVFGAERSGE